MSPEDAKLVKRARRLGHYPTVQLELEQADAIERLSARVAELDSELERERMRLVACGVVALADTPTSAVEARSMHPDYRSASCDDVARRVDECIALRARVAEFEKREKWYVERAADGANGTPSLDGYRELGSKLERATARVAELEKALDTMQRYPNDPRSHLRATIALDTTRKP